jgi:hypothetical protein
MEYNFSSISVETIAAVEKKLINICKNMVDDINNFIHVLNNQKISERSGEMNTVIHDILRDQIRVSVLQFTETMNKVQRALAQYL